MARHGPLTRENARAILKVSVGANKRELTAARNRMLVQYHPDKPGGTTRLAQSINGAFDVLITELQEQPPPPPTGLAEEGVPPARPPTGGVERVRTRSEARHEEDEEEADADEDAEVDASNSETEAEVRPPTGGAVPEPKSKKRKRQSGASRREKVAAPKKKAGYVDRGRRVFRDNQGVLATGTKRTCLADALWMALEEAGCAVDLEDVRSSIMPEDPDANTPFAAAQDYAATHGFTLACVSKEMQKEKGGYEYNLLLRETGLFLVQLRVTTGKDDPNPPDLHVCFYDGTNVRDNGKYTKVKILEESDRSVQGARLVFGSLFNGLEVRTNNIYELKRA